MIPAGLYLADTSAIARVAHPPVQAELVRLGRRKLLATCVTVDLEVGYSARDAKGYRRTADLRAEGLADLPLREAIGARAREVQRQLAGRGHHRAVGVVDLLTAAIAEHYRAIVLHYDSDFDRVADVTGQQVRWIVPRGSVDS